MNTSSLFVVKWYPTEWINHTVYSFINWLHWGYFHLLATVNNAAMNIHVHIFIWTLLLILLGITGLFGNSMSNFLRNCQTVFYRDCSVFTFPPALCQYSNFSILNNTCYFPFKNYSHPSGCEVVSHCSFICIPLMTNDIEHLFICLLTICSSSLEKYLFGSFA